MQVTSAITIDLSYLHSVSGGDAVFEKVLLSSAIADIQLNIDHLKKSWQEKDAVEARNAAHTLKSVMTIAGLRQLESYCKRIDVAFRDGIFRTEESPSYACIIDGWMQAKPKLEGLVLNY